MISAKVAALTEGVLKIMLQTKLKIGMSVFLVLAAVGSGIGLLQLVPAQRQAIVPGDVQVAIDAPRYHGSAPVAAVDEKPVAKFPLGKDTTYVTGPLDTEGYIDY